VSRGLRTVRDTVPGLSAIGHSNGFQALLRSWRRRRALEQPLRFASSELLGRRDRAGTYALRGSAVSISLRHRSRDVEIVDEIFVEPLAYDPPPGAAALLAEPRLRVLDLGGNVGLFGAFALEHYDVAQLTSFEPDPHNLPVLRRCRAANPGAPWHIVEACAGTRAGELQFASGHHADSRVLAEATDDAIAVAAIDVFPFLADADFVKIDIEGSEWDLLDDERFRSIPARVVVMEWHAAGCLVADPHETVVEALREAGFSVEGEDHGYPHGTVWAWRTGMA